MNDPDLAESIASRICHDLVSPVGAIVNGTDLARELGGSDLAEAIAMIGQSAARASRLLQFHRIAFGAAEADAPTVARGSLAALAAVLAQPPRVTLEWDGTDGPPLTRPEARLVALLLLCARSVTGMRGIIRLRTGTASCLPLALTVEGGGFSATLPMLELLEGAAEAGPVPPRTVEFTLAARAARGAGAALTVAVGDGLVEITAEPAGPVERAPGAEALA